MFGKKKPIKTFVTILLSGIFTLTIAVAADTPSSIPSMHTALPHTDRLPGVDFAEGISEITGVAISPLLGVSFVGAWRYYYTPEPMRDALPWFCHPAVWGFLFTILFLCLLKDILGTFAPPLIKKPFDIAELFESKLSALVASTAFVPFIAMQMTQNFTANAQTHILTATTVYYASIFPISTVGIDFRWLFIPFCILSFLVVWMTGHAINVLISICPFGPIDTLLKLLKATLLSSVILSYIINPYLGAVVSMIIIFIAVLLVPSTFRLAVFGTLFAIDTVMPWRAKRVAEPIEAHAFLARTLAGVPKRTYGRVIRTLDGRVHFSFRPWLILPRRTIQIPGEIFVISKGLYFPCLLHKSNSSKTFTNVVLFLPRYRSREKAIAEYLGITDIRDSTLVKGLKAIKAWFNETINIGKTQYSEYQQNRGP